MKNRKRKKMSLSKILIIILLLIVAYKIFFSSSQTENVLQKTGDLANEVKNNVAEKVADVTEKVSENIHDVKEGVMEKKDSLDEKVSEVKEGLMEKEKDVLEIKKDFMEKREISKYNIPDYFSDLEKKEEDEFIVEVSRKQVDCTGVAPRKCLQVKKEGEEWMFFYDTIYGLDHKEGDYYMLKVKETKYETKDALIPADASSSVWEVVEVLKKYGPDQI